MSALALMLVLAGALAVSDGAACLMAGEGARRGLLALGLAGLAAMGAGFALAMGG